MRMYEGYFAIESQLRRQYDRFYNFDTTRMKVDCIKISKKVDCRRTQSNTVSSKSQCL